MRTARSATSPRTSPWPFDGPEPGASALAGFGLWILAGVPLVAALVVMVAVSVSNRVEAPEQTVYPGVRTLHVTTDHGDIEVVGADVTEVRVARRHHGDAPRVESSGGGSLTIGLVCDEGFVCTPIRDTPRDHTDYAFVVPAGIDVTVHSRNGDVVLRGLTGRVDTHPGNGTITRSGGAADTGSTPGGR
ncbi:hypothetical protein GCM10010517_76330 [Streptosporangium fragile]|uniref:Adhesin domain-containing protein n=1 Tax=Streptosporangium fragile TaxID=46186 RepID=A0ABN3WC61_9ACTN